MKRRTLIQATASASLLPHVAHAQEKYPSKPITWVCPYAAGGNADSRSRQVAKAIEKAVPCKRIGMSVIGLEVPHVHVHLIPLQSMADMTFGKKEPQSPEQMSATAQAISANI
mgnify:CR=1 FL=1